jgi:8-oxo-dGTP diphosphatase
MTTSAVKVISDEKRPNSRERQTERTIPCENPGVTELAEKHLAYGWIARDDTILFIRREATAFLGGRWELPGGTVELGESPEQTAVREIAEETGLTVRVTGERYRLSWPDVNGKPLRIHARIYDVMEEQRGDVVLNPGEHDEHAWLTAAKAAELDLLDHVRRTLGDARGPWRG